jgi:hypothetical protein
VFQPKNGFYALGKMIQVVHPGSGSCFFYPSRIQGQKGIGSRIQIYNTVACFDCFDSLKVLECLLCDVYRNHRKWVFSQIFSFNVVLHLFLCRS